MSIQTLTDLIDRSSDLTSRPSWKRLEGFAQEQERVHLRDLMTQSGRYEKFFFKAAGLSLDLTRQRWTPEVLEVLLKLANERHLQDWIEHLMSGSPVNNTENRPALHSALRSGFDVSIRVADEDVYSIVEAERKRVFEFATALRSGEFAGYSGKKITDVVNIGIGGSDLGLVMIDEALAPYRDSSLKIHFVSNIDGSQLTDCFSKIDPETTLFIVCSKSFTTEETRLNAEAARKWFVANAPEEAISRHFVAVSVNAQAMDAFGIAPNMRFSLWDWVGGRFSLWSAIGLVLAIGIGPDNFSRLLAGAAEMDRHFREAPLNNNLPVLLGLLGVWNRNFLGLSNHAVLPYDSRLSRLPAYLQQLEMESNGKSVTRDGKPIDYSTCPVIWGEPGSNAQHSFFQLLHQGTVHVSMDFVAPKQASGPASDQHKQALMNMLAQADAFACGYPEEAVKADLSAARMSEEELRSRTPHKVHGGNRPSSLILLDALSPESLGALIALYEHKVFVQGVIWGVNSFDQWGVERGKVLAGRYAQAAEGGNADADLPPVWKEIF